MNSERRKHKRVRDHFLVKYPARGIAVNGRLSSAWNTEVAYNVSAGGALFNYDKDIKITQFLDLKLNFPATKIPINCVARVVRVEETNDPNVTRVAVNFAEIDPNEKIMINRIAEIFSDEVKGDNYV